MEIEKQIKKEINKLDILLPKVKIHAILAQSYSFYFLVFIFGMLLDFVFPNNFLKQFNLISLGFVLMVLGSILVLWAQRASSIFKKLHKDDIKIKSFKYGPYRFTRNPTHFGLTFLMIGFGLLANAIFIIIFTIIYFFLGKLFFIKKEEKILEHKYGDTYLQYKKQVKF